MALSFELKKTASGQSQLLGAATVRLLGDVKRGFANGINIHLNPC